MGWLVAFSIDVQNGASMIDWLTATRITTGATSCFIEEVHGRNTVQAWPATQYFRSKFSRCYMKKYVIAYIVVMSVLTIFARKAIAQETISYQLCEMDFRSISMHADIPAGAVYANTKATAQDRAQDVVKRLSFEEKLALTGGLKQFYFAGVPRLGIPPVYFADATQGVHEKDICTKVPRTTSFPSGLALAATWNTELASRYANAISEECRAWGIGVLLGPGLNLYRNSEGGRNFEYFGEDPYLTSKLGVSYVKGMQSLGTVATVKHFLGNEQELFRHVADVQIGERALHELYLAPFKAAIEQGGALAVMTGNNLVNGHPGAADTPLAEDTLRANYGFKGVIMSDWANSMYWPNRQAEELTSGHSLLMENNDLFVKYVVSTVAAHPEQRAPIEASLDKMVTANLYTFFASGTYDRPYRDPSYVAKIETHAEISRQTAEEAITLLKNDGNILPLSPAHVKKIAVVGTDAALTVYGGKGSGQVKGYDHVDFLAGLKQVYGDKVIRISDGNEDEIKSADAVLLFVQKNASEGQDFPYDAPDISAAVTKYAALSNNVIVIYSGGNGFPMPWLANVRAVLFSYFLGQQSGVAMAEVLSGAINPSGKLPFTIEASFKDSPAYDYNKLPDGTYFWAGGRGNSLQIEKAYGTLPIKYDEGVYIGYRWYEKKHIQPLFPFGFGLSYTRFGLSPLKTDAKKLSDGQDIHLRFSVTNTGSRSGATVVQLYIHDSAPTVDRPVKELKGFQKVVLRAGESKTVTLPVSVSDISFWNDVTHRWQANRGKYELMVGFSYEDTRQSFTITY